MKVRTFALAFALSATAALLPTAPGFASAPTWVDTQMVPPAPNATTSLSCPRPSVCWDVGYSSGASVAGFGAVAFTRNGGRTWSLQQLPPGIKALSSVSCPDLRRCYAVGATALGRPVFVIDTRMSRSWRRATLPFIISVVSAVSCSSERNCVVGGTSASGDAVTAATSDFGRTWVTRSVTPSESGPFESLSCPLGSQLQCWGVVRTSPNAQGLYTSAVVSTTDGASWTTDTLPTQSDPYAVSCPSTSLCVAVGNDILTTSGGPEWQAQALPAGVATLTAVSCSAMTTDCVGSTALGAVVSTTDGGGTWTVDQDPFLASNENFQSAVSCFTRHCLVAEWGTNGARSLTIVAGSADNGSTWTTAIGPQGRQLMVSCPSSIVCYGLNVVGFDASPGEGPGAGFAVSSDNWATFTTLPFPSSVLDGGLACPDVMVCYLAGTNGLLATHDGGSSWTSTSWPSSVFGWPSAVFNGVVACGSPSACVAVAGGSSGLSSVSASTADGGATWTFSNPPGAEQGRGLISCGSATVCYFKPTESAVVDVTMDGGLTWSTAGTFGGAQSLSCPSAMTCYVTDGSDTLWKTTDGAATWRSVSGPQGASSLSDVTCGGSTCMTFANTTSGWEAAFTSDGGATWTTQPLPPGTTATMASCPDVVTCYATSQNESGDTGITHN